METEPTNEEVVEFFKAMADANRLKIIGLLANRPHTVEQLAALLNLGPSTISHHLTRLSKVGLVEARAESYYSIYSLNKSAFEAKTRRLLHQEQLPKFAADVNLNSFDQKVLRDYSLPDGRLKIIPAQRKKLDVILRHVVHSFEPGKQYTEKEVNEVLSQFHEDTASLRRELVGNGYMQRDHGIYWRTEDNGG